MDTSGTSASVGGGVEAGPVRACSAPSFKRAVADGYIELLGRYRWDWFCTFTFRESVHPEAASKRFRYFVDQLNQSLYGKRWYQHPSGGIYWCRALEYQKRGVIHYHALLGDFVDLNVRASRMFWKEVWFELAGIARIEVARSREAVNAYCAKYVTKDGELDVSNNLKPEWAR